MMNSAAKLRVRLARSASVPAVALMLLATPAFAQTPPPAEDAEDTIIVTGFAASLESAAITKREARSIVESVSAEDIGKLPDASIAESISRLPGLTSQRLNGRSNVISIRGLGPDLSTTLLNGREQTSTGDSRAVEYDQYPSEIINQVVVYKSPEASLIGQGLAGTVDVRTIRPLDYGKPIFAIGGRGVYTDLGKLNAGSNDKGYRVNATFVDQFADDTFGIALAASYVDEPYQVQEFNAWGYAGAGTAADPSVIGGNRSFVTSTNLKRLGVNGAIQWKPAPTLTLTLDGFYSKFEDNQIRRGIELPLGFQAFGTVFNRATATAQGGQFVSGSFSNVRGVIRNDPSERNADLYSGGFNAKYEGLDGWKASFDFGYSKTERNELIFESYSGTGFNGDDTGNGAAGTIGFTSTSRGTIFTPSLNYANYSTIFLTDPLGWGGGTVPQAGYFNNRIVDDELKQYRATVERTFDNGFISAIKGGLGYTDRTKSLVPDEFFIRLAGGATQLTIPQNRRLETTSLGYLGLGPIVSYDPRALLADGVLTLQPNTAQDVLQKGYSVSEQLLQAYLQADFRAEFGAAKLTGNIGAQIVWTDQESTGLFFPGGVATPLTLGTTYRDFLPSLNVALELPGQWIIRAAASRQIQRPRIDDTRVAIGYGFNQTLGIIEGGGGNPFLQPYRANGFDFNVEKYFGRGSYISAQFFYKDLENFIFQGQFPFDFSGFPPPTNFPAGGPTLGFLNVPINTGGGRIIGGELSTNIAFGSIIEALDGFGITGGVGYTDSSVRNERDQLQQIPGYSRWTASGTAYFEKWGFSARGSVRYRSSFLGELSVFGGARGNRQAVSETIIDAQIGYEFKELGPLKGLSIFLQGQNLTNEPFKTIAGSDLQVIDFQTYGRRFYLGASIKF